MDAGGRPATARCTASLLVAHAKSAGFDRSGLDSDLAASGERTCGRLWRKATDCLPSARGADSSSVFLHNEPWLSINGMQSGHGSGHDLPVWEWIARDYAKIPAKPTLDLEPNYEDHPFNPWPRWDPATGYFRDLDVRKQVYRSVFAGGCGVTYGHHAVWGFVGGRNPVINHADRDWIDALQRPAGREMVFLRDLLESRPFLRDTGPHPGRCRARRIAFAGDAIAMARMRWCIFH